MLARPQHPYTRALMAAAFTLDADESVVVDELIQWTLRPATLKRDRNASVPVRKCRIWISRLTNLRTDEDTSKPLFSMWFIGSEVRLMNISIFSLNVVCCQP